MLDIKVVTQLPNDRILTTALCFKPELQAWIYESVLWDQVSGTVLQSKKFSESKQLEALAYHLEVATVSAGNRKSAEIAPDYDECVS